MKPTLKDIKPLRTRGWRRLIFFFIYAAVAVFDMIPPVTGLDQFFFVFMVLFGCISLRDSVVAFLDYHEFKKALRADNAE